MNKIINIVIVTTILFIIIQNFNGDYFSSSYENYYGMDNSYSYGDTIINVYEITDELITESKQLSYYESISSSNSDNNDMLIDNIVFIEN